MTEGEKVRGRRFRNVQWEVPTNGEGQVETWEGARLSVLMDIRDELRDLNRIIGCNNCVGIPKTLRSLLYQTKQLRKELTPNEGE